MSVKMFNVFNILSIILVVLCVFIKSTEEHKFLIVETYKVINKGLAVGRLIVEVVLTKKEIVDSICNQYLMCFVKHNENNG